MKGEPVSFIDEALADRHSNLLLSTRIHDQPALALPPPRAPEQQRPGHAPSHARLPVADWERFRKENRLPPPCRQSSPRSFPTPGAAGRLPGAFHAIVVPRPSSIDGLAELVPDFTFLLEDLAHLSNDDIMDSALDAFPKVAMWLMRYTRTSDGSCATSTASTSSSSVSFATPTASPPSASSCATSPASATSCSSTDFVRQNPGAGPADRGCRHDQHHPGRHPTGPREQGLEQGLTAGRAAMLTKLLTRTFGGITPEHQARIAKASPDLLERVVDRALAATSLDDVFCD